jgi:alginate O-acetyltransferase complex protein AlgJ
MPNATAMTNGVVMIALLAGGAAMSGYVFVTPELRAAVTKPLAAGQYIDGKITATIESIYEDELPIRNPSGAALNALTYSLFGEGRKGVVVGEAGWLFSAEEYEWTPQSDANLELNLAYVAEVAEVLKARGISLQIALVPEKADIHADHLMRPRPAAHRGKYARLRAALLATGATVPDLREPMRAASATAAMFFPTDTHWSVAGAGVVADALARSFPARGDVASAAFELKTEPPVQHDGDLERFIELGAFDAMLPGTDHTVIPVVATASGGSVDDFLGEGTASSDPAIALVGTSYSAAPLWSFEPQLKGALGADVVNYAQERHGPIVPMRRFLEKLAAGSVTVKAVIWEIPIRYLDDDSSDESDASSSAV